MTWLDELLELYGDRIYAAADEELRTGRPVVRWEDALIYLPDCIVLEELANGNDVTNSGLALVRDGRRVVVYVIADPVTP